MRWLRFGLIILGLSIVFLGAKCPWQEDKGNNIITESSGISIANVPSGLTATTISSSQINLTWTDNSDNEDGFKIERKTDAGGIYGQITSVGANISSCTDTGLSGNTTYYYKVKSYNSSGESNYSNEVVATTPITPDTWTPTSMTSPPSEEAAHSAIWTSSEMIIWGGGVGPSQEGAIYYPVTDTWNTGVSLVNAPSARSPGSAIWTGSEMLIWGGVDVSNATIDRGGRYNPLINTWTSITTTDAPSKRWAYPTVWTGTEMLIWGGTTSVGAGLNTGGKYNPLTDSWLPITTTGAPSLRWCHTAVWTGTKMLVWGGYGGGLLNTGGKYNPSIDAWSPITTTNAPSARYYHTTVWTGTEMIIWGGRDGDSVVNTGAKYNPSTDTWIPITTTNAPLARQMHTAVWTGTKMLIWGGRSSDEMIYTNTGGIYDPSTDTWAIMTTTNAPSGRQSHTAIWTGSEIIIWGGTTSGVSGAVNTGGRYKP